MAKITKTKSGKYRTLVFYQDPDGTRHRKSITHEDKATVKLLAAQFENSRQKSRESGGMTVEDAIKRYIDSKENVLSPSTIRSYRTIQKNNLLELQQVKLRDLTQEAIQKEINRESQNHKPKGVANMYGLLTAALKMFIPDFSPRATLPTKERYKATVPVDDQIKKLLKLAEGTDIEIPIMLAAMGSLRAGEIAALTAEDVLQHGVRVNKAMVRNQSGKWEIKHNPKTAAGIRVAPLPKRVLEKLQTSVEGKASDQHIFHMTPETIYEHYAKLRDKCGMEHCRFHDLRHYYASMAHVLGVPDQYIMLYGGWADKSTLTKIYQQAQEDYTDQESTKVTDFFGKMLSDLDPKR